jgi:Integrase core domain
VSYEYVHIAIDDFSRLAYAEVLADEKATTAVGFLHRAVGFYARHGIRVERVLSDNGSTYRSVIHAIACRQLGIKRELGEAEPTWSSRASPAARDLSGTTNAPSASLLCLSSRYRRRSVFEESVEAAGEVALEAAVCFASCLAFLEASFDVGDRGGCERFRVTRIMCSARLSFRSPLRSSR